MSVADVDGEALGVPVGVGVCDGDRLAFVTVGDGELECVRVGTMLRTGIAGALVEECRGLAVVT